MFTLAAAQQGKRQKEQTQLRQPPVVDLDVRFYNKSECQKRYLILKSSMNGTSLLPEFCEIENSWQLRAKRLTLALILCDRDHAKHAMKFLISLKRCEIDHL